MTTPTAEIERQTAADILDPPKIPTELDGRRPEHRAPVGDWRVWLMHPGRRWGKGFSAARWIVDRVRTGEGRSIALVGSTVRAV